MQIVPSEPQTPFDGQPTARPEARVQQLLALYGDSRASVAGLLCDRHCPDTPAYAVVEPDYAVRVLTYGQLKESSERFAAALAGLGVKPGDRVATLLGKSVEHLIVLMGIWRLGAVHVPLFTAFAPPSIAMRLLGSNAKVVVCDEAQRSKLETGADIPAHAAWRIVIVGDATRAGDVAFADLLARHSPGFVAAALGGRAAIVQIYTSGTTGHPKGVLVPAIALASFHTYMEYGLDVREDDVFWNAADPGWGYGLYFGVLGSFCVGVRSVWVQGSFSPELTYAAMSRLRVTNFTAAPTAYRALRASNVAAPPNLCLRCASSAGEPLTPEVNAWAERSLGVLVHDHYGQTETGMLINNHQHPAVRRPIKAGSMGHRMPGWTEAVLYDDRDEVAPAGTLGRIAFDVQASPLAWFSGYVDEPDKSTEKFSRDRRWYLTGDMGVADADGYLHFMSRGDDMIIMAGYRIGPFEVESVLLTHPAVAEAAVIAAPDEIRGEVLEACIVLRDTALDTTHLARELQELVKTRLAVHAYPRIVHFLPQLPKTPSGKIQRYLLRQRRQQQIKAATS